MAVDLKFLCTRGVYSIIVFVAIVITYWTVNPATDAMGDTMSTLVKSKGNQENSNADGTEEWHYQYSTVAGFFQQDARTTSPKTFDAMQENFGLIEQEYDTDSLLPANGKDLTQWQRFAFKVRIMNERAAKDVSYRLLYLGRHGNGYHNVGSSFYGSAAWDCYYSTLDDDPHVPSIRFFDAHLTALGKHQAHLASELWRHLIVTQHIPTPQSYYSSPHTRAIQTANLTFAPLSSLLPASAPFQPMIKELLREGHGIHTCDSRPTRTYLQTSFPHFSIEPGFSETDMLFSPVLREPPKAHTARMVRLLDDVFASDSATFIGMTSHHGTISATLRAIGHRTFPLATGGAIPVFVKVKKVAGQRPDNGEGDEPWETKPDCSEDPMKAGRPGYANIAEWLDEIERRVPRDWTASGSEAEKGKGKVKASA